jgi:hypothetical protein
MYALTLSMPSTKVIFENEVCRATILQTVDSAPHFLANRQSTRFLWRCT